MSAARGSQTTRSAKATTPGAATYVARRRRAQPNGIWGMALFLCAEVTLFGTLLGSYFYLDFKARSWPPYGIKAPSVVLPFAATGVLVATVVPIWLATRAARQANRNTTIRMIAIAFVIQTCYLAAQVLLFRHDLNDFSPQGSAYGSIYFTLLTAHHLHVLLGLLLDLAIVWQLAAKGLTNYWFISVRALALYWYVVAGLAIVVVFTQLSPSL
jgi:heme/copper-type cytochrome/quinol oxidase subunit 3